ncbi:hypothetical protein ColLi_06762 [Colletotrichum liriopes]|uniref:Uncharacterized protein n=1 Tax=Colletotrichum liriopes TaxID=708192 RepID=A0AA37GMS9_9PEZI|nr:hypothetical protein ColLi_06762 [Colletotrichum liriopes]
MSDTHSDRASGAVPHSEPSPASLTRSQSSQHLEEDVEEARKWATTPKAQEILKQRTMESIAAWKEWLQGEKEGTAESIDNADNSQDDEVGEDENKDQEANSEAEVEAKENKEKQADADKEKIELEKRMKRKKKLEEDLQKANEEIEEAEKEAKKKKAKRENAEKKKAEEDKKKAEAEAKKKTKKKKRKESEAKKQKRLERGPTETFATPKQTATPNIRREADERDESVDTLRDVKDFVMKMVDNHHKKARDRFITEFEAQPEAVQNRLLKRVVNLLWDNEEDSIMAVLKQAIEETAGANKIDKQ